MKKILCPTDFSHAGENAITYAAKLAQRLGASLHLIHLSLFSDLTPEQALVGAGMSNAHLTDRLEKESLEVSNTYRIPCYAEPVTSVSSLAKSIAHTANDFDLVVMGSNGEDDFYQRLFGSTTYRVIKRTGVPVILVPEHSEYIDIRHIAYAFDYWRVIDVPMEKVVALAKDLKATITLVQVMETSSGDAEEELRATEAVLKDRYSKDVQLSFKTLYDPQVTHALREFMLKGDYDALALCFREGTGGILHTRVIRDLSNDIWYPLLAFH